MIRITALAFAVIAMTLPVQAQSGAPLVIEAPRGAPELRPQQRGTPAPVARYATPGYGSQPYSVRGRPAYAPLPAPNLGVYSAQPSARRLVVPPTDPRIRRSAPQAAAPAPASAQRTALVRPAPRRTIDPAFRRTEVDYVTTHEPGTIVVDTATRYLYLVQENGKALRYGVGVGRDGFQWKGTHKVTNKREWPDWRPPAEMLQRQPNLPRHMPGGPNNPLGARALYLGSTLYRIHGSNEPWTIGQAVSSGCFRMTNEDVTDLYDRVPVGAKVVVL